MMSSLLLGSRSWRNSAFDGGTTGSCSPAMICTGVGVAEAVQVGGFDPVLEHPAQLERVGRAATAHDQAAQAARMQRGGEQRGPVPTSGPTTCGCSSPNVSATLMRNSPIARGQQPVATLRMAEPWQVDRHQMGVLGQPRPGRLEGEQAFWPWAQQQGVIVAVLALGVADGEPVDGPELRLDGGVQPGGHGLPPKCLWSGQCRPALPETVTAPWRRHVWGFPSASPQSPRPGTPRDPAGPPQRTPPRRPRVEVRQGRREPVEDAPILARHEGPGVARPLADELRGGQRRSLTTATARCSRACRARPSAGRRAPPPRPRRRADPNYVVADPAVFVERPPGLGHGQHQRHRPRAQRGR
jgi:hypothetical protein